MEYLEITGSKKLAGKVKISGSKNASLAVLPACLLTDKECVIENVPNLIDVYTMIEVLRTVGCDVKYEDNKVIVKPNIKTYRAPYELVKKMRASFYITGALLARVGECEVPLPGGCVIGTRPVNFHIDGFKKLGCEVKFEHGFMKAKANKLVGNTIYLNPRWCSVGTTINIILAATLATGKTVIQNAAREPEVVNLVHCLIKMGAKIKGEGTSTIEIEGVKELRGIEHYVIPDRIEAGTYLAIGAVSSDELEIDGISSYYLEQVLEKLEEIGYIIKKDINRIIIRRDKKVLSPCDITTAPYPGFPTDMQPAFTALLTKIKGRSCIIETIYDSRFKYVQELQRMGANITLISNDTAIVEGVDRLTGCEVEALDIRGGAALIIAALQAEGKTKITGLEHINRGYENIEEKLKGIGANIRKVKV